MAVTKSKKTPAKKKSHAPRAPKFERPAFLTPVGIAIPCMPLQAFVDMLYEEYRNPFYTEMTHYTKAGFSEYEHDVYKGWLISKKRCAESRKFEVEWVMKLPDDYSVAHFPPYFDGETEIPQGKWIGPTSIIKAMHEAHRIACDRVHDLVHIGFNVPCPVNQEADSLPDEIAFDDFESDDLDEVWFRGRLQARNK